MTNPAHSRLDEQHPWPGLSAFDEAAARFFNGRDEEIASLNRLVLQSPLTVLFGMSGLGKTSLLHAGLFPQLRSEHMLPVYVRLDFRSEAPLIDQVRDVFMQELARQQVDAPAFAPEESLWSWLHHSNLELWSRQNRLLTPVFVLDQFEEVFTLGTERPAAVAQLRRDLSDLVENRVPATLSRELHDSADLQTAYNLDAQRYRVLLSFREDFLPAVEGWKEEIPAMLRNRLRLLPLAADHAFEAVHGSAPHLVDEEVARRIVTFVAAAQDRGKLDDAVAGELLVEPALLSLVCHGLNERRLQLNRPKLDAQLLEETGGSIIADFYKRAVAGMREAIPRFIEAELITERGYRKPCDVDDARTRYGITDTELATLINRRLLRIEPSHKSDRIELTHDLLTGVVKEQREVDRRRERTRRRARMIARRGLLGAVAFVLLALYLERQHTQRDRAREQATQAALMVLDTIVIEQAQWNQRRYAIDATVARLRDIQFRSDNRRFLTGAERGRLDNDLESVDSLRQRWYSLVSASENEQVFGMRAAARTAAYVAGGRIIPFDAYSRLDAFDVSRGRPQYEAERDPSEVFGDSTAGNPERETQPHFLPDRGENSVYVMRWTLPEPRHVGSVAIFLSHDGYDGQLPSSQPQRAVRDIKLSALLSYGDTAYWTTIAVLQPSLPYAGYDAYGDPQPLRSIAVCIPTRIVNDADLATRRRFPPQIIESDRFRLEVAYASIWGPRITEIDAYPDAHCGGPPPQVLADLASRGRLDRLSRDYAASTVAVSSVLSLLPLTPDWQPSARENGALRFLAQTEPDAWNQQLIRWAGRVLASMEPGSRAAPELFAVLSAMAPHWGDAVARATVDRIAARAAADSVAADSVELRNLLERVHLTAPCAEALRSVLDYLGSGEPVRRVHEPCES